MTGRHACQRRQNIIFGSSFEENDTNNFHNFIEWGIKNKHLGFKNLTNPSTRISDVSINMRKKIIVAYNESES